MKDLKETKDAFDKSHELLKDIHKARATAGTNLAINGDENRLDEKIEAISDDLSQKDIDR